MLRRHAISPPLQSVLATICFSSEKNDALRRKKTPRPQSIKPATVRILGFVHLLAGHVFAREDAVRSGAILALAQRLVKLPDGVGHLA